VLITSTIIVKIYSLILKKCNKNRADGKLNTECDTEQSLQLVIMREHDLQ
jgi:hypothetical protein